MVARNRRASRTCSAVAGEGRAQTRSLAITVQPVALSPLVPLLCGECLREEPFETPSEMFLGCHHRNFRASFHRNFSDLIRGCYRGGCRAGLVRANLARWRER